MEQTILKALTDAHNNESRFEDLEDLARFISDELKRSICHQLMKQLDTI